MLGFVYPNEVEVQWDLLIVLYPYITGLVAGAFIISAIYYAFGVQRFRAVARLSLLTALAFLLVCPIPLLLHAGRPERGLETMWTPNITSAMAMFGFIWTLYLLITVLETWLVFRPDVVARAQSSRGVKKGIYWLLALGVYDVSEASLRRDGKIIKVLAFIGFPVAVLLHGYVGFVFGAVKANPWWSSDLTPVIFLASAIVSGVALLIVVYLLAGKLTGRPTDHECLHLLGKFLLGFVIVDLALEGLIVAHMAYTQEESWGILSRLVTEKLSIGYFGIQLGLGGVVPALALGVMALGWLSERVRTMVTVSASLLILVGVFAMRWNVVIGGQLYSRSLRGFISYTPEITGLYGVLMAVALFLLPLVILGVLFYLLPPWREQIPETSIADE